MLSTLLSSLQNLISSSFVVGSFFPALAFWFANAAMLFVLNARFETYVRNNIGQTAGLSAVLMTAGLIGVAMFAYVLSALLPAIQSLLEGTWSEWLVHLFIPAQMRLWERLEEKTSQNQMLRGSFGIGAGGQTQTEVWKKTLLTARQAGNNMAVNHYRFRSPSAEQIAKLARRRRAGRAVSRDDLNTAVTVLTFDLRANNADLPGPDNDYALEGTRALLRKLIDYAEEYAKTEDRRLITARAFSFGALPLAPTRMGNVAKTIQHYSVERYDLNFEHFWSRLQLPVQRDKDFGPTLQASKTQLDFLISCCALTFVWGGSWAAWLLVSGGPDWLFLATALLCPVLAYAWYRAAVVHYRTFADVLRSSIDLFRFDLLNALHFPRPDGVLAERELWQTLDALNVLFELRDVRYVDPKS
ncbi:MAG TPA: hypothetical protein VGG72_12410 [Bryobacteraceae bacterium]|jgi:hypothetical protein